MINLRILICLVTLISLEIIADSVDPSKKKQESGVLSMKPLARIQEGEIKYYQDASKVKAFFRTNKVDLKTIPYHQYFPGNIMEKDSSIIGSFIESYLFSKTEKNYPEFLGKISWDYNVAKAPVISNDKLPSFFDEVPLKEKFGKTSIPSHISDIIDTIELKWKVHCASSTEENFRCFDFYICSWLEIVTKQGGIKRIQVTKLLGSWNVKNPKGISSQEKTDQYSKIYHSIRKTESAEKDRKKKVSLKVPGTYSPPPISKGNYVVKKDIDDPKIKSAPYNTITLP